MEKVREIGSGEMLSTQADDLSEKTPDVETQSVPAITPDAGEEMTDSLSEPTEVQE